MKKWDLISRHIYHIKLSRSTALPFSKEELIVSSLGFQAQMNLVAHVLIVTLSSFIKIPWQLVFFFSSSSLETTIEIWARPPSRPEVRVSARTHDSRNFYSAARNNCANEWRASYCSVILDARVCRVSHRRSFLIAVTQTNARVPLVFLPLKKRRARRWSAQLNGEKFYFSTRSRRRYTSRFDW